MKWTSQKRVYRLGDRLGKRDQLDDRLDDRKGKTEGFGRGDRKGMLGSYDMCSSDREDERSPPKLELAFEFRHTHHSPPSHLPHTMDITSVRFRPVPVVAQAVMTSTYGHPRLNLPEMGKVNTLTSFLGGYEFIIYFQADI